MILADFTDPAAIISSLKFNGRQFDAIIIFGAVDQLPVALASLLLPGGCLVAPVNISSSGQQLQVLIEAENGREIRKLTEMDVKLWKLSDLK